MTHFLYFVLWFCFLPIPFYWCGLNWHFYFSYWVFILTSFQFGFCSTILFQLSYLGLAPLFPSSLCFCSLGVYLCLLEHTHSLNLLVMTLLNSLLVLSSLSLGAIVVGWVVYGGDTLSLFVCVSAVGHACQELVHALRFYFFFVFCIFCSLTRHLKIVFFLSVVAFCSIQWRTRF